MLTREHLDDRREEQRPRGDGDEAKDDEAEDVVVDVLIEQRVVLYTATAMGVIRVQGVAA